MKTNMNSRAYERGKDPAITYGFGRVPCEETRSSRLGKSLQGVNAQNGSCSLGGGRCGNSRGSSAWGAAGVQRLAQEQNQVTVPEIPESNNGCGCGCEEDKSHCGKLKKQIQTVDFALYEIVLYLDAYPEDCEALNTYHMLLARRKKLAYEYESHCGPLTAWGNVSTTSWDWVKGPSPWEYPHD